MRKCYTLFVAIFWLTMMGLLFQKEVLPTLIITNPAGYEIEITKDYPVRESWMGIYFRDKKIGFANTVISQDVDKGVAGYRINETTLLKFSMHGEGRHINIKGNSFFKEDYTLKSFDYRIRSGGYKLDVAGSTEGADLNVTIEVGGETVEKSFRIKHNTLISNSISPILLFKKLDRNKEINFEIFDPITFGTHRVSIRNVGTEAIEFNGKIYNAHIFETDISGIKTRTWMKEDGDILKEESGIGFTMKKETPEYAADFVHSSSFSAQDLVSEFSLSQDSALLNPREISYLKIDKNGTLVEIFKDSRPRAEKIISIPVEDIPEEDFIQSQDEKIVKLARQIVGDERNSWEASKKVLHWVYNNIEKRPTFSVPSSLDVLRTMQGDCNEHTVLFTALTRSAGIPTEMIAGLVYLDDAFYYHAWPRVYVGEWVNMDPTLGQEVADATHIPLLEGGLKEQLELIKIIGNLEIKVVDYK